MIRDSPVFLDNGTVGHVHRHVDGVPAEGTGWAVNEFCSDHHPDGEEVHQRDGCDVGRPGNSRGGAVGRAHDPQPVPVMKEAHLDGVANFVAGDVSRSNQAFARFHAEVAIS